MDRINQVLLSVWLTIFLIGFGCAGYMIIEGWDFMDSLYMTVITLTTVGYGEVKTVGVHGRVFTIMLLLLGVGYFLYVVGNIIQFVVEGRIRLVLGRRKLDTQINKLRGHYIICGYGRIGRVLTRYLIQRYVDVVVIELDANRAPIMDEDGILYLIGEAMEEGMLKRAGIQRAKGMVTAVGSDADNVFLVLTAKQLHPGIFVVARAGQESTKKTLLAAGADKVISPYDLGARRMAHAILRPTVIQFLETAFTDESINIQMEEITVRKKSEFVNVSLAESGIRQHMDINIVAIKKADDHMDFNPKADTRIEPGDTLVVVGSAKNLKWLEHILSG